MLSTNPAHELFSKLSNFARAKIKIFLQKLFSKQEIIAGTKNIFKLFYFEITKLWIIVVIIHYWSIKITLS
jgi:hypothetical protein